MKLTDAQKSCHHVFIGKSDGVHCTRCGLHLTAKQYRELLHPPEDQQDAADTEPDKEPAGEEKPTESAAEAPQAKPKRIRKKKEATASE